MRTPNEPLELSAPLAWRLAPALCHRDPATGEDCSWYHGFWQFLRLMELVVTPQADADFLSHAMGTVDGANGAPRVLISGAADYSVLAHVLAAFRDRKLDPEVTVVDSCMTPLHLNRWYAERVSGKVEIHHGDLLEYSSAAPFDAVCAHSFLGHVPPGQWPMLVAGWRTLLRPGGAVIAVNPVRRNFVGTQNAFTEAQAGEFRNVVLKEAGALGARLNVDAAELVRMADVYSEKRRSYPVRSPEEMVDLFERGGFRIDLLASASVTIASRTIKGGPAGGGERVRIIARRL